MAGVSTGRRTSRRAALVAAHRTRAERAHEGALAGWHGLVVIGALVGWHRLAGWWRTRGRYRV